MKRFMESRIGRVIIIGNLLVLIVLWIACGGGGGGASSSSSPTPPGSNEVTITGSFTGINAKSIWLNRIYAWLVPKAYALNPSLVERVLVFSAGDNSYTSANVKNGAFSINVKKGSPVGMIFVGSNNTYLGYLTLKNGIDSLPMQMIKNNVASIDLGVLSSSGLIVEPTHNPLGDEFPLTAAEQLAYYQANKMFAEIIKNPDVDGNGVIDILEGNYSSLQIAYYVTEGDSGGSLTPSIKNEAEIAGWVFFLALSGNPDSVTITGPSGSGLSNTVIMNEDGLRTPYITMPNVPPAGQYVVTYGTTTLTFTVADQSQAKNYLVLPVPTFILNEDNTINQVSWVYKIPANLEATITSSLIIDQIQYQMSLPAGHPCINGPTTDSAGQYWSGWQSESTTNHIFTCQQIHNAERSGFGMAYNDIFGNHIVVNWNPGEN